MSVTMTTKDNFPIVDITHKPKRMQSDNLRAVSQVTTAMEQSGAPITSAIPASPTLERAIEYYESHAEGEFRVLYLQTAKWLRDYMSKDVPVNVSVPDGTDIDKAQELLAQARRGKL